MTTHKLIAFTLGLFLLLAGASAQAGGCYVCTTGSSTACRDYCQYEGADTFDNRHKCEARGCKIGGTTTCPSAPAAGAAGGPKVCQVQDPSRDRWASRASLR